MFRSLFETASSKPIQEYLNVQELVMMCKFLERSFGVMSDPTHDMEAQHALILLRVLLILSKNLHTRKLLCETLTFTHVADVAMKAALAMMDDDWLYSQPFSTVCNANIFKACSEIFSSVFHPVSTWILDLPYQREKNYSAEINGMYAKLSAVLGAAAGDGRPDILKRIDDMFCIFNAWLRCDGNASSMFAVYYVFWGACA